MTEWNSVTHDGLGHLTQCYVDQFPTWKSYTIREHRPLVEKLAAMGSWLARRILGLAQDADVAPLDDDEIAQRFFYGDVETLKALRGFFRGETP